MTALSGRVARLKITSAAATTTTGVAMTAYTSSTDRVLFRISNSSQRHWDRVTDPTVYVNTTAHTDFAINYVQGKITFGTPLTTAESAQVTADVRWHTASYLPVTRSWSADVTADMLDVTTFSTTTGAVGWRSFQAGLSGAMVDLGRIVTSDTTAVPTFFDRLNTDTDLVVELIAGSTYKWEAYCRVAGDSYSDSIDGLLEESVSLQVDGPLYYATTE